VFSIGDFAGIYLDCPPGEYDRWVTEMQVEVSLPG
jgi:hypothetical protein